jgi:hypothetical protein
MLKFRLILDRKLGQAFSIPWDEQRVARAQVVEDRDLFGLSFFVQKRNGQWIEVHREPCVPLSNESEIDDLVARGLSTFLMCHPSWPR